MWEQKEEAFTPPVLGQPCKWKSLPNGEFRDGQVLDRFVGRDGYRLIVMNASDGQLHELPANLVAIDRS